MVFAAEWALPWAALAAVVLAIETTEEPVAAYFVALALTVAVPVSAFVAESALLLPMEAASLAAARSC
jgi:hypothetical protein